MSSLKNTCAKFQNFAKNCKILKNSDITEYPFFINNNKRVDYYDVCESSQIIKNLAESYCFPIELKMLYHRIGDNDEIIYNDNIYFLSPQKIQSTSDLFVNNGQNEWLNIAIKYYGMGWHIVLAWHKVLKKCFLRFDGGSSGYDANDNFVYFITSKKFDPSHEKFNDYLFDLDFDMDLNEIFSNIDKIIRAD